MLNGRLVRPISDTSYRAWYHTPDGETYKRPKRWVQWPKWEDRPGQRGRREAFYAEGFADYAASYATPARWAHAWQVVEQRLNDPVLYAQYRRLWETC